MQAFAFGQPRVGIALSYFELRLSEVRSAEVRRAEVRPAEVYIREIETLIRRFVFTITASTRTVTMA